MAHSFPATSCATSLARACCSIIPRRGGTERRTRGGGGEADDPGSAPQVSHVRVKRGVQLHIIGSVRCDRADKLPTSRVLDFAISRDGVSDGSNSDLSRNCDARFTPKNRHRRLDRPRQTSGASGYAPGHQMQTNGPVNGSPGASGYAPGKLKL